MRDRYRRSISANGYGLYEWPATSGNGAAIGIARYYEQLAKAGDVGAIRKVTIQPFERLSLTRKSASIAAAPFSATTNTARVHVGTRGKGEQKYSTNHSASLRASREMKLSVVKIKSRET